MYCCCADCSTERNRKQQQYSSSSNRGLNVTSSEERTLTRVKQKVGIPPQLKAFFPPRPFHPTHHPPSTPPFPAAALFAVLSCLLLLLPAACCLLPRKMRTEKMRENAAHLRGFANDIIFRP